MLRCSGSLREGEENHDKGRVKYLLQELADLWLELSIPIRIAGNIVLGPRLIKKLLYHEP